MSLNYSLRTDTPEPQLTATCVLCHFPRAPVSAVRGVRSIKRAHGAHRALTRCLSEPLHLHWHCPQPPRLPPPAHQCRRAFSGHPRGETVGKGRGTKRAGHEGGHRMRVRGKPGSGQQGVAAACAHGLTSLYQPTMSSKLPTNFRKISYCENRVSALRGISFCCWKFRYLTSLSTATS